MDDPIQGLEAGKAIVIYEDPSALPASLNRPMAVIVISG